MAKKSGALNIILPALICLCAFVLQYYVIKSGTIRPLIPYITVLACVLTVCRGRLTLGNIIKLVISAFVVLILFDVLTGVLATVLDFLFGTLIYEFVRMLGFAFLMIHSCVWVGKKKLSVFGRASYSALVGLSAAYALLCELSSLFASVGSGSGSTIMSILSYLKTFAGAFSFLAGLLFYLIVFFVASRLSEKIAKR